jgi:hypothetical protein
LEIHDLGRDDAFSDRVAADFARELVEAERDALLVEKKEALAELQKVVSREVLSVVYHAMQP